MSKVLDRIIKLFKLGSAAANTTEAETLAAITKAKQLMAEHAISEYVVQMELDKTATTSAPRIKVNTYTAYTRKINNLARYDGIVALCVGALTGTEPFLRYQDTINGRYTSMHFIGAEVDATVAGHLFMIFLPEVRRAARKLYGSEKWDKRHTSYAIGYATRMLDRAQEMVRDLTPAQQDTMALVVRDKQAAIAEYKKQLNLRAAPNKDKNLKLDADAYFQGYRDGDRISLNKRGIGG